MTNEKNQIITSSLQTPDLISQFKKLLDKQSRIILENDVAFQELSSDHHLLQQYISVYYRKQKQELEENNLRKTFSIAAECCPLV